MSKNNFYQKNIKDIDYNESLSKIMILGLTGMAALGASMLVVESTKVNASMITKTPKLFRLPVGSMILRSPAFKPSKPSKPNIPLLNRPPLKNPVSTGSFLSSFKKYSLTSNKKYSLTSPGKNPPIIIPTGEKRPQLTLKTKK